MEPKLLLCIPGPWADRSDFLRQVITSEPIGQYMFAGMMLADVHEKDHLPLEFTIADPDMGTAFKIAGQGKIPEETLTKIGEHRSVVYLHFPLDIRGQRERLVKYTQLMQRLGGLAVKVESAGKAHSWERWFKLLNGSPFDLYCSAVVLIGDTNHYYSCGMHHFGLPECAVPNTVDIGEAADLMNRFNLWQIDEAQNLNTGHTFSLSADAPRYRLALQADDKHEADDAFFNSHGLWYFSAA
jgi:hypothetical protein